MPKIRCPACNEISSLNPRLLGREIACPKCGQRICVPEADRYEAMLNEAIETKNFQDRLGLALGQLDLQQSTLDWNMKDMEGMDDVQRAILELSKLEYPLPSDRSIIIERELAAARVDLSRPKVSDNQDIDMTPMVDVVFQLLIFFMLTASFVVQKSIQRPAERSEEPSLTVMQVEDDPDTVHVQVDEFNAYNVIVHQQATPAAGKQDLIVLLSDVQSGSTTGGNKLVIEAHENCIHAAVVSALDAGREAQFESFEVRTVEQFD